MTDPFATKFSFTPANRLCIGVEEEVWTVRRESGLLTPLAPHIFKDGHEKAYPFFKPELPSQQIEAVTPVCRSMKEVELALRANAFDMERLAKKYDVGLSRDPIPTKPYSVSVFPSPRFLDLQNRFGKRLSGAYVAGLHVHIGLADREEAILAMNVLRQHLPTFLALSASSPYFYHDTKYASFRHFKYKQMAGAVAPPHLISWREFTIAAQHGGFYHDPRMCWWGVRINPLGTVELRVCDVQNSYNRTLSLVALTRMLVRAAIDRQVKPSMISSASIEDRLMMSARGIWASTDTESIVAMLVSNRLYKEEAPYVKRLFP